MPFESRSVVSRRSCARPASAAERARAIVSTLVLLIAVPAPVHAWVTLLSDLPPDVESVVRGDDSPLPDEPAGVLAAVLLAAPPYSFDPGPVRVVTDVRWFTSVPEREPGSPMLVLRRWPGDSALALYALQGGELGGPDTAPPFESGSFVFVGDDSGGARWWSGEIGSAMGTHPARWVERRVDSSPFRLGALLLPGDAGLGADAVDDMVLELQFVFSGIEFRADAWPQARTIAEGTELRPPVLSTPPGPADEGSDPWQTARGSDFSIGLPPGLRVRRADRGFQVPRGVPEGLLWVRGRFTDRDGESVVVGDGHRAGYVAEVSGADQAWLSGQTPPLGAPGAKAVRTVEYDVGDETGSTGATAGRWRENGFAGEWLVFRLGFESRGIEIGLPILSGRQSPAVFWIPMTYRDGGRPPAPPPVDPAERFGIRFEPLEGSARRDRPWSEGTLQAPGLRVELPRGWWPVVSLRSRDGFPIRLIDAEGAPVGRLERIAAGSPALQVEGDDGWGPGRRPARNRAAAVYRAAGGKVLYVGKSGGGFLLEPAEVGIADPDGWKLLTDSVQLVGKPE